MTDTSPATNAPKVETASPERAILWVTLDMETWGETRLLVSVLRGRNEGGKLLLTNLSAESYKSTPLDRFEDFGMRGHPYISTITGTRSLIGLEPCFRHVYSVDRRGAERMLKVLKDWERFYRRRAGDTGLVSHVDYFRAFADFVGAKEAVFVDRTKGPAFRSYADIEWNPLNLPAAAAEFDGYAQRILANAKPL